ncbi:autotransporter strand-loop-strand O-heptosyltransferase [Paraburkholderia humisilvae]|uniref:Glycosyltransferase TibC n=1 Tax=Paraburkholderia humisilvae TaxID=627669 RepID=A0A6J5EA51_9BURK|nr:autotransporter strand-loop-strand O-heptosyltransferase [Paraburkholderia humisilvae]CAB3762737.1 Glycosyltransferase TibC [Paraburkholderia humisilvae]
MSQTGKQSRAAVGSADSAATGAAGTDALAGSATTTAESTESTEASAASHAAPDDSAGNAAKGHGGQPVQNPPAVPTQEGPAGIRFDFNDGCRVTLPAGDGDWRVLLRDTATANPLFDTQISAGVVASSKKYYVPFEIEVWSQGKEVFRHRLDLTGRNVLVHLPVGTLGDTLGWFPYVAKFEQQHRCRLTCVMGDALIPLFQDAYPSITFATPEAINPSDFYATYNIGLFFTDDANVRQPCDFRLVGLHRTAAYILGVDPQEERPTLVLPDDSRPIPDKYVCIAAQSTTQCKYWNNPSGWREIVQFLKQHGYRVICIDQKATHGSGVVWNHIPYGSEDFTGERPLAERARWLKHAEFFVGLSSGLSWLAWTMRTPVVMISGFTHPTNEFDTPYRVINYHTCNSCWNDVRVQFDHHDFLWCPRHAGTPRQFECTRLITAEQVKNTIRRVPVFNAQPVAAA